MLTSGKRRLPSGGSVSGGRSSRIMDAPCALSALLQRRRLSLARLQRSLMLRSRDRAVQCLPPDSDALPFRDARLLAALQRILPQRFADGDCAQLWVPACGSGEAAWSLAMLVEEALASADADFIVYGTDTDVALLQHARRGVFSSALVQAVPTALRERHLQAVGDEGLHRVARPLARRCQFMLHGLDAPPPFVDLSLVLCRGTLLQLAPSLQRRRLEHLHRALQPGGLLLLAGEPDAALAHEDLFTPHPQAPGLYLRRSRSRPALPRDVGLARGLDVYAAAFHTAAEPQLLLDERGCVLEANAAAQRCFDTALLTARSVDTLFHAADAERLHDARARAAAGLVGRLALALRTQQPVQAELRAVGRDPDRVLMRLSPVAEDALQASRKLDALMTTLNQGVVLCDEQSRILDMNARAEALCGLTRDEALGQLLAQVFRVEPLALQEPRAPVSMIGSGEEYWLSHRDGRRLSIICSERRFDDGSALWLFDDVSEHKLITAELAWRATHDAVTGLLNRETFELRARKASIAAQRGGFTAVLCYIDVDQFKLVNDRLGHGAGDELLRELAAALRSVVRPGDAFARLGGDEFGVLMPGLDLVAARPAIEALLVAARRFRFHWDDTALSVTISIGASLIDAECDVTRALSLADAACFGAKDAGRDRLRVAGDDDAVDRRRIDMSLVGRLGRALEAGSLELHYDDVVDVSAPQRVVYRELLVRLRERDGRLLAPAAFIQAAERFFMMASLDRWVIRHALRGIAQLPPDDVIYAVNLSAQSLSDERLLDYVLGEIRASGVDPRRLCFEITETAAVSRLTEAVHFVGEAAAAGCRFALDDFGAGMASFAYLKNFDVDFIKIDGGFVRSMLENRVDRGVVESINRIGHQMGLRTIAEHVESKALLEPLRAIGVNWAQGHGIAASRPFADLLKRP